MLHELGQTEGVAVALTNLGWLAMFEGDAARAEALVREALAGSRQVDQQFDVATQLLSLAHLAIDRGDAACATDLSAESLRIFSDHGYQYGIAYALEGLADAASVCGDLERALHLAGAAAALRANTGASAIAEFRARHERRLEPAHAALGNRAATVLAQGRTLKIGDAVSEALTDGA